MKTSTMNIFQALITRYPLLSDNKAEIFSALELLVESYQKGGKLLVCGNGGSAADALHIVGELMKSFVLPRKIQTEHREFFLRECTDGQYLADNLQGSLPAIALVSEISLNTAYSNDIAPDLCFAQQVYGYGCKDDVLLAISTSGSSKNVLYAMEVAALKNIKVIGLTGQYGEKMRDSCDVLINVPEKETFKVQELHLPVYHALCMALENEFFGASEVDK